MLVFLNLPVIPRGDEIDYVQCGFCRSAFAPSVLETGPPALGGTSDDEREFAWRYAELTGAAASTLLTWDAADQ